MPCFYLKPKQGDFNQIPELQVCLAGRPMMSIRLGRTQGLAHVLAWVLAQGANMIPIPGARTVAHAVELALAADELKAMDEAEFSSRR